VQNTFRQSNQKSLFEGLKVNDPLPQIQMETLEIWKDHMEYHSKENKEIDLEEIS
jgi:hypothetical protein